MEPDNKITADLLRFNPPDLPQDMLADFMHQTYGISGRMTPLPGERDQNFRVSTPTGEHYVLKISASNEDASLVDLQVCALEHIRVTDPELQVPRHIATRNGELVTRLGGETEPGNLVRLLTWVAGTPLEHQGEIPEPIVRQIGGIQARLCIALKDFDHPAAGHFMPWDTMNGLVESETLRDEYLPRSLIGLCTPVLTHLESEALPEMHRLPGQVIHNDVHAGNVLCDDSDSPVVSGVIDFGDIVKRPLVVDLATSLSNIAEHNEDVGAAAGLLLEGFESRLPLPQEQRHLLYDALCARSILTVMLMHFHARNSSQPEKYGEAFITHAAAGVTRILTLGRDGFQSAIS